MPVCAPRKPARAAYLYRVCDAGEGGGARALAPEIGVRVSAFHKGNIVSIANLHATGPLNVNTCQHRTMTLSEKIYYRGIDEAKRDHDTEKAVQDNMVLGFQPSRPFA